MVTVKVYWCSYIVPIGAKVSVNILSLKDKGMKEQKKKEKKEEEEDKGNCQTGFFFEGAMGAAWLSGNMRRLLKKHIKN